MRASLERQKYLIDYTLASLLRRKTRNLGLLLVYTLLVFLFASVLLLGQALRREAATLLQDAPEVIVQRTVAGRHDLLPADWLDHLRQIRGVSEARGRLWGYYYDPAVKANYTVMAAPERPLAEGEILIGATLARVRGIGVGDVFSLRAAGGAQAEHVADPDPTDPRQRRADQDFALGQRPFRSRHHGVIGLDRRIVVIAPQSAARLADAANLAQVIEPIRRQQVVPPRDGSLHDHLRRVLQQRCRFPPQGLAEQQDRGE